MGYAVCHRDASGTLQVDDVASLDAAVEVVERLRNGDGAGDVRVFREIPIEVKTYYKISIVEDEPTNVAPEASSPVAPSSTPVAAFDRPEAAPAPEPVPAAAAATVAPVDPLPGAFPLAAPTPPPAVEVHDADLDTSADGTRRHSLFGRGG